MLEARGVCVTLGAATVVEDVSGVLNAGRMVALLGSNGAGKSSLLNVLAGVLLPSRGQVFLQQQALGSWPLLRRAQQMASVGQAEVPDGDLTALEVALLGRAPHLGLWGLPHDADLAWARQCLEALDVGHLAARRMNTLSGGEAQRAVLARALCSRAPVMLLDEPTAALDVAHAHTLMLRLRERAQEGALVVMVLHDVNMALQWADEVWLMRQGRMVAQGPTGHVLTAENLSHAYGARVRLARAEERTVALVG